MEVKSKLTLQEFAKAMQALDLSDIPEARRPQAVAEHFFRVMSESMADSTDRMAVMVDRARAAQLARRGNDYGRRKDALRLSAGGIILPD